jgi:hypothetical protein
MEDSKLMIIAASFIGALVGVYYIATENPLNNSYIFMALFALVGVAVANGVLLVGVKFYDWLKLYYEDRDQAKAAQTVAPASPDQNQA